MSAGNPRRGKLIYGLIAIIAGCAISAPTEATEGGGSQNALGSSTINPGVAPTPPGFNFINYNLFYSADRLNNSRGNKAIPDFHIDLQVVFLKLEYSLPEPILGIRFGLGLGVPLARVNLATGSGAAGSYHQKAGLSDIGINPIVGGWEYDTPVGHVNQMGRFVIIVPTGKFRPGAPINLGRNYTAYSLNQGNSLSPTPKTNVGFQLIYLFNEKNTTTNYQSGQEFDVDWSAGYEINRNWSVDLNGYFYKQITNDYRSGLLVNGNGNKGQALAIGPQLRLKLHPGALTLKWQSEMAVQNRAQGNRFWLQFYYPLGPQ